VRRFIIEQSDVEITSHSGLALVGMALNRHCDLTAKVDRHIPLRRHGIPHSDVLRSLIGLLCLGKSDFDAVENVRKDAFFATAMGISKVPSAVTLRQRLDERADDFRPWVEEAAAGLLVGLDVRPKALATGHVPLDADVTPFDNSNTRKEGVSRTYQGCDGYAPMAAYLGQEGYALEFELRAGSQHCQRGTPEFLRRVLPRARRVTEQPLLLRLDGGNDALENIDCVLDFNEAESRRNPRARGVDFIIKWNPRQEDPNHWLAHAERHARFTTPRPGKRVAVFDVKVRRERKGSQYALRRVMRVVERTLDRKGQVLLIPEIEIEGWWTSLDLAPGKIIKLYADHGTAEQFHSEFKTDLAVERLPSGKFSTNAVVLACAVLAYNILRYLGQKGLTGPGAPLRHRAVRRRIRTVIQELMYRAARVVESGRRLKLAFGRHCRIVPIFDTLYQRLAWT